MPLLIRRAAGPPLLPAGELTYEADPPQRGRLRGVGDRHQLTESTGKILARQHQQLGLVVLPAHDPTAAQRPLDS